MMLADVTIHLSDDTILLMWCLSFLAVGMALGWLMCIDWQRKRKNK
jgi:hypothetical protein